MLRTLSGLLLLAPRRGISEIVGGKALSSRWYAPTWSVAGGVLLNTPTLGAELLTNGNMELDASWASSGTPTTNERSSQQAHGGTYSRKFITDAGYEGVSQSIAPTVGVWHYLSGWWYGDGAHTLSLAIDGGNLLETYISNAPAAWSNKVASFRCISVGVSLYCRSIGAGATAYLDDVTLKSIVASTLFCSVNSRLSNFNLVAPPISAFQAATQCRVVLRLDSPTNPQNFVIAYVDGAGNVKIEKCAGGTYTPLSTVAAAYGATKYFSAKTNGSSISIYYGTSDYCTLIATVTVPDASIVNNVRHGLFSTYSGNQFAGTFSVVRYA